MKKAIINGIDYYWCGLCKRTLPFSSFSSYYLQPTINSGKKCKECMTKHVSPFAKRYMFKYKKGGKYYQQVIARSKVYEAVKIKKVVKSKCFLNNESCSGRLEGHHYLGYEKEHWLDIVWLCTKHHHMVDKNKLKLVI